VRSVTSPQLLNLSPNDVVEGSHGGEVFVTQWLQYAAPMKGKLNPDTWQEWYQFLGQEVSCMLDDAHQGQLHARSWPTSMSWHGSENR
jgi:hypothetical protein